ncbi:PQQ-dependent sugar dehydrogenase [Algisphaera agarilytica]|uniref:Glucose/arabinose dehydrogenase n=1 Tax=Algisphaera agarilytica TaxID=1385975 RepID=A0A7X0H4T7_9BACT|nr:PQQ-dependent sugar dehydrogenase [Algisphaera agarilytica]MBB6429293.1 glucose/arabinose dehydrogenase [Algisphaera agarilytica]
MLNGWVSAGRSRYWFSLGALLLAGGLARPAAAEIQGLSLVASLPAQDASAVFATHASGYVDRMFVVDQRGRIETLDLNLGSFGATPFLDIRTLIDDTAPEQGLLGLAFDPNFHNNGYFYVNYTYDPGPGLDRTRIDRFQVTNPGVDLTVDAATRSPVLEFEQDFRNHNGGWIGFSPTDNYLYIASGDGGSGNDPNNRAQSLNTLLGKMLRIDPSGDDFATDSIANYAIPQDNPFVGDSNARDEIWAYGLRNPWRDSFDRATGDLWIGDVGQEAREEINVQRDGQGGANFGWRLREGDIATPTGGVGGPEPPDHVGPAYDYPSNGVGDFGGNSTVGGYVYRGPDPDLQGLYFFGDSFPRQIWTFDPADPDGTVQNIESLFGTDLNALGTLVSFGEDREGNLYMLDLDGDIFRIDTDIPITLAGDYNGNGIVDAADYTVWQDSFGSTFDLEADGNGNGVIDAADYTVWQDNFGNTLPVGGSSLTIIPEPASLAWVVVGLGVLISSQRRGV